MFLGIAIVILILWALGFFIFPIAGGLIHSRGVGDLVARQQSDRAAVDRQVGGNRVAGGLIHILLIVAIIAIIWHFLKGRNGTTRV